MFEKYYRFGEVSFKINAPDTLLEDIRFEAFAVNELVNPDYIIEVRQPEPGKEPTESTPVHVEREENHLTAYMKTSLLPKVNVAQILCGVKADRLLPEKEHVMLHCSYVVYQNQALLFCAPSGVGKSTQAMYWNQVKNVEIINEDRAVISRVNGTYHAHGCWAMGHGSVCKNVSAPVRAIILLGQGEKNIVYNMSAVEIIKRIVPQCSFDDQKTTQCKKMIEIVAEWMGSIPVLGYDCINKESAVEELEKYL